MKRDFLHVSDFSKAEIIETLGLAADLKARFKSRETYRPFAGFTMARIFAKPPRSAIQDMSRKYFQLVNLDPDMVQAPFPDGFRCTDTSFELFRQSLADQGLDPRDVAGVITESYQGIGPNFLPDA